jgi:restriction endonuclease Mrr
MAHYCRTQEELQHALEGIYDEQWYANVPFDGGQAMFEGDASDYVSEQIETDEIQNFFAQFGEEPEGEQIIAAADLLVPGASQVLRLDVSEINDELVAYLAEHPEKMREMPSRKFEELVADLFKSKGYDVTLTPRTRDGGFDVRAVQRSDIGTVLIIIECKRYAAENTVGVEIVRGLYGIVEQQRATKGIIVTTSFFSSDAKKFHNDVQYRLVLADFDVMRSMLNEWRLKKAVR